MTARSRRRVAELAVVDAARDAVNFDPFALPELRAALDALDALDLEPPTGVHTNRGSPETAHEAAEWMKARVGSVVAKVFRDIYLHDGATTDQVEQRLRMSHQTVSPRVTELRNAGWVYDSGYRRETRSGKKAIVYKATEKARQAVDQVPEWSFHID